MKIPSLLRNIAICALLGCLLFLTACSQPLPTLSVELPYPSYLLETAPDSTGNVRPSVPQDTSAPVNPSVVEPGTTAPQNVVDSTQPVNTTGAGNTQGATTTRQSVVSSTAPPSTAPRVKLPMPSGNAQIVQAYNDVTKLVNSKKAGFNKRNVTTVSDMVGMDQIPNIFNAPKLVQGKIDEFLGVGTKVNTAAKGQATTYLLSSSLTESDITSASCTESGDNYIITIKVNSCTNPDRAPNNPLGRYTADYKTAAEGKATIEEGMAIPLAGTVKPTVESITITANPSTITCTMNKYTGQAVSIKHSFSFSVVMLNVVAKKIITINIDRASGKGSSDVTFTNFVF